jgi:hypothetical protein
MVSEQSPFELLGLPAASVNSETLSAAYLKTRQEWFFKQFEPATMIVAHSKIRAIDEAYQALRDPRRQTALLREAHKKPRPIATDECCHSTTADPTLEPTRLVNRMKIVRDLLRQAKDVVARSKAPLGQSTIEQMTRSAFDQGIDYADAEEIVERIVREVEIGVRPVNPRKPNPSN